jgi:hypothetical protein
MDSNLWVIPLIKLLNAPHFTDIDIHVVAINLDYDTIDRQALPIITGMLVFTSL